MSLITCCPACGTMFKVVPDQLRISEGWVRCGHCADVFDATAQMQDPGTGDAPIMRSPMHGQASEPPQPTPLPPSPAYEYEADFGSEPEPGPASSPAPAAPALRLPEATTADDADDHGYPPFELPKNEYEDFAPLPGASDSLDANDPMGLLSAAPASQLEPELQDVSFVRQARRKAFWASRGMRAALAIAAVALAALLAMQFGVQERDRIAASQPALRPLLEALCGPLSCEVGPPRQIEAIVIDSSAFNKLRGDAYRLAFTLKNQAAVAVAMPAIELTLTDSQDQPLVRRVLTPAELGAGGGVIGASADWSGTLAFGLSPGNPGGRVAGYRLLAFYP